VKVVSKTLRVALALALVALCACRPAAARQPSGDDVTAANNPLTPKIKLNFHDLCAPEIYDLDQGSNTAIGPQLTIPTATNDQTGTGKWQGGFAMVAAAPRSFGIAGALVTGNTRLPAMTIATLSTTWACSAVHLQPSAGLVPAIERHVDIRLRPEPVVHSHRAGAGKVWRPGGVTINAFAEPQFTVAHDGAGQPKFQVFMGLNLQFPLARK
jgi:hypothetical protein